ncbi:uncharacterized protein C12orf45 homolog [Vombatus ursinus]|uniref:uncharacterized protein C12orf45 homolog n=1 Tax=Vombatus ursinus TaxID=29139 RepID=UPI000FFD80A1|nr:uncharacterized protein C12orf45 homolog [Vombatus ursinus]
MRQPPPPPSAWGRQSAEASPGRGEPRGRVPGLSAQAHAHAQSWAFSIRVSRRRDLRAQLAAGMAGLEQPGNGGRGRAARRGGPGGVRTTVSRELLRAGCAGAGGLQDTLLIRSKGKSPGLKTVRVERSSLLERVKNFLPHIEQANKKLREEMASGPPGLFNIENVDDSQEKTIEMDVAVVEVSSSDSEDLSSGESSECEDENSITGEVTVENIKLPKPGGRRGKIEVLDT